MGEADLLQELADRALVIDDAKALLDHPLEVDAPPSHDTVLRTIGTRLDDLGEGAQLVRCQPRQAAFRGNVLEPVGTVLIEPMNPVAQRLPIHRSAQRVPGPCHRQSLPTTTGGGDPRPNSPSEASPQQTWRESSPRHGISSNR